jgi:hypothetical protein
MLRWTGPAQPISRESTMRMSSVLYAALVACLLFIASLDASAKENYHEATLNADTHEKFHAVAENVRNEMQAGGRYEFVKAKERDTIERALAEMEDIFAAAGSVDKMKQDDKVKLFNDQEIVNSILTRRDKDRVICEDKPKLGSHVRTTSCHTYGQQEDARRGSKDQMDEWTRRGCAAAGCVGTSKPRPTVTGGGP